MRSKTQFLVMRGWVLFFSRTEQDKGSEKQVMSTEKKQDEMFNMAKEELTHQFKMLEQKIKSLIELTESLKKVKTDLLEKLQAQEETLDTLAKEIVSLKTESEKDGHRLATLLEKVDRATPDMY